MSAYEFSLLLFAAVVGGFCCWVAAVAFLIRVLGLLSTQKYPAPPSRAVCLHCPPRPAATRTDREGARP